MGAGLQQLVPPVLCLSSVSGALDESGRAREKVAEVAGGGAEGVGLAIMLSFVEGGRRGEVGRPA